LVEFPQHFCWAAAKPLVLLIDSKISDSTMMITLRGTATPVSIRAFFSSFSQVADQPRGKAKSGALGTKVRPIDRQP
jgi:hypothetical protein